MFTSTIRRVAENAFLAHGTMGAVMATKKRKPKSLTRSGEPSQKTQKGLEIPVPTRKEVSDFFGKVIRKRSPAPSSSGHGKAKH